MSGFISTKGVLEPKGPGGGAFLLERLEEKRDFLF